MINILINKLFDKEYYKYFNKAANEVQLLKFLNILCIPLSKFLIYCKLTPTQVSHLSNISTLLSIYSLLYIYNPWVFSIFWVLGLFFDISDGMMARALNSSTAMGSFYDHMSDQVKFILLFFAIGLKYSNNTTWVIVFLVNSIFLFMGIVNHLLAHRKYRLENGLQELQVFKNDVIHEPKKVSILGYIKRKVIVYPTLYSILFFIYTSVFVMYGNIVILLAPVSFSETYARLCLILFMLVSFKSLISILKLNIITNRELFDNKISWK